MVRQFSTDGDSHRAKHLCLKAPTHRPDSNQQPTAVVRPLCCLSSDPFSWKAALNTLLRRAASSTVACMFCACTRCNKRVALVYKKDTGREAYAHNSPYFWSKWNFTISDKKSCILNMQRGITKQTANLLRLCMLNRSRQRPHGSESFQCSWTHQTYLFLTSSESP